MKKVKLLFSAMLTLFALLGIMDGMCKAENIYEDFYDISHLSIAIPQPVSFNLNFNQIGSSGMPLTSNGAYVTNCDGHWCSSKGTPGTMSGFNSEMAITFRLQLEGKAYSTRDATVAEITKENNVHECLVSWDINKDGKVDYSALSDMKTGGKVGMSAAPLPVLAILSGSGLLGMVGFGRRRQQAS